MSPSPPAQKALRAPVTAYACPDPDAPFPDRARAALGRLLATRENVTATVGPEVSSVGTQDAPSHHEVDIMFTYHGSPAVIVTVRVDSGNHSIITLGRAQLWLGRAAREALRHRAHAGPSTALSYTYLAHALKQV